MDKESIVFGLVLSLAAQGLYDALLYGFSGKTIEENGAVFAAFVTVTFILLIFEVAGNFRKEVRRRIVKYISRRLRMSRARIIKLSGRVGEKASFLYHQEKSRPHM